MPPPGAWDEEDEWYSGEREHFGARYVPAPPPRRRFEAGYGPPPPRGRDYLAPNGNRADFSYGVHRSRSQGHAPAPNISIYNTVDADQQPHISSAQSPGKASPRGRSDWSIEDELAQMRLELSRQRSRSRGHADRYPESRRETSPNYEKRVELEIAKERVRLERQELERAKLDINKRKSYDLELENERRKREDREREEERDRKRIIAENMRKIEEQERAAKEARKRAVEEWARDKAEQEAEAKAIKQKAIDDFNRKKAEEEKEQKEERKRAVAEYQAKEREKKEEEELERKQLIAEYEAKKSADAQKAKEQEEALIAKLQAQEKEKKDKEKAEWEAFLLKQKMQEEEERVKKEKEEKELEEKMTRRLQEAGFQYNQIQALIKPEKAKDLSPGYLPNNPLHLGHPPPPPPPPHHHHHHHQLQQQPTYIKVSRDHLSIDTLTWFNIPWRYDDHDRNYFIIMREMSQDETDMLFEHTRSLRTRNTSSLLIEERGGRDKPEYAFVRRKSKRAVSPSPRRKSSPKNVSLRLF